MDVTFQLLQVNAKERGCWVTWCEEDQLCETRSSCLRQWLYHFASPAMLVTSCPSPPSPASGGVRVPDVGLANERVVLLLFGFSFKPNSKVPSAQEFWDPSLQVEWVSWQPAPQSPSEPLVQKESLGSSAVLDCVDFVSLEMMLAPRRVEEPAPG